MCACMYVYVRERRGERERECVCVCVFMQYTIVSNVDLYICLPTPSVTLVQADGGRWQLK